MKLTFDEWLQQAEAHEVSGIDIRDLPDMPFRDWYDEGIDPKIAARRAVRRAMRGEF